MFNREQTRSEWNKSRCNPFNSDNTHTGCNGRNINVELVVPEKPNIRKLVSPRVSPFAKVEVLRTPIDNLHFELYEYSDIGGEFIGKTDIFDVYKYQAYLPVDWYKNDSFFRLRCYASNDAGNSEWSEFYDISFSNSADCYIMETKYISCDTGMCCSHIYVCI